MTDLQDVRLGPVICSSCCCFWFIFSCICLPFSFKALEQGRYGITLNWTTQKIGEEVTVQPGMYMLGLGNEFIEYPSIFQYMYFSSTMGQDNVQADGNEDQKAEVVRGPIKARSKDGLEMFVALSFQWKIEPPALHPLYGILGNHLYQDEFVRFARAAVVEACSQFPASLFFTNRTEITEDLFDSLVRNFDHMDKDLKVSIQGLQLREVDLPNAFDDEIANTQEQLQLIEVAKAERQEKTIAKQREKVVAEEEVKKTLNIAAGTANETLTYNKALVDQMLVKAEAEAKSNAEMLKLFGDDPQPFQKMFEMMKVRALKDHKKEKLLVNI